MTKEYLDALSQEVNLNYVTCTRSMKKLSFKIEKDEPVKNDTLRYIKQHPEHFADDWQKDIAIAR